jgi:hypothetical protein
VSTLILQQWNQRIGVLLFQWGALVMARIADTMVETNLMNADTILAL